MMKRFENNTSYRGMVVYSPLCSETIKVCITDRRDDRCTVIATIDGESKTFENEKIWESSSYNSEYLSKFRCYAWNKW